MLDLYLVYQFVRRLATPFKDWEAFKLGIIDERGNVLKKRKSLATREEKNAFGIYDLMILNIKKLIEKVPGGQTRLASYMAALYLIREWNHFSNDTMLTENVSDDSIYESIESFSRYLDYTLDESVVKVKNEEVPTMNVGSGNIAGLGVGPQGELGLNRTQMRRHKSRTKDGKKRLRDIIGSANIKG
jgi:hypothetical protein